MTTKNLVFYAAATIAVVLLPLAAWNGAIVSAQSSQVAAAPPTIGEWSTFLATAGGSVLSGLVALATWASKYLTGKPQSVAERLLPILLALLDFVSGERVANIEITLTNGEKRSAKLANVVTPELTVAEAVQRVDPRYDK